MPDQVSADELADRLLAHPSVARLHGGQYGEIATYLPGRRITGVRVGERAVEVAVVLRLDRLLAGGVVITGDITLRIADVDLVRIDDLSRIQVAVDNAFGEHAFGQHDTFVVTASEGAARN